MDLASRDSATVGGTVATNAGGLRVLRYGDTRAQLLGVEAVLGTGAVVSHLGGLLKDNTGYHLPSLLCGSEGTLAVVTAARLRLVPPAPARVVALLAFDATAAGGRRGGRPAPRGRVAGRGRALLAPGARAGPAGHRPAADPFAAAAPRLPAGGGGRSPPTPPTSWPTAVGSLGGRWATWPWPPTRCGAAELWRYREAHPEAVNALGAPHKLDVTLPAAALAGFIDAGARRWWPRSRPGTTTWLWGHVADGNIHVNVTGVAPDDERVDDAVLRLVAAEGGSISAEHGIGTAKRRWLAPQPQRGRADRLPRAIKRALDPDGVLNPHVLVAPAP